MNATIAATSYLSAESMPHSPDDFVRFGDTRAAPASAWIVDPGLAHHRGHHHPLDVVLLEALTRRGDRVEVLCLRNFPPEPGFVPCFRHSIYEAWATSPAELDTRLAAHADAFVTDLSQAIGDRIANTDLLLFPTAHLSLLAPLHRWLDRLPVARRPGIVRLHFHVSPTHNMDGDATRAAANDRFAAALQALVRDHAVRCSADHPQLAAALTALCRLPVATTKSPHVVPPGVRRAQRGDGRIRLLFIGEPRAEKGYVTVMQALPGILAGTTRCDVRFVLPVIREADLAYLRTLPPDRVSVRLEDGLPSSAYFDEIAHADYVLCVYDRARYAAMSSGIAVDAALLDVPIVVTRGTATERAVVDRSRIRVLDDPTPAALVALCASLEREPVGEGALPAPSVSGDTPDALGRAAQLERDGRRVEAAQVYRTILDRDPRCGAAWHALGLLALADGDLAQAVERVEKATLVDDANPMYQRNLCELSRRAGRLDKATLAGRRACKLAPDDLDAHYNLGVAYTDAGELVRAHEAYSQALRIDPGHGLSWNNLGAILERRGDREQAAQAYARAVAIDPRHAEAQNNLGALRRAAGRIDEARACFLAALEARPDFAEARRNLAELDAPAASATPVDATSAGLSADDLHLRGIALYREGRLAEALDACDRSLALKPDAPAVLNSRGFVLQDLDRMEEALACFERAVALAPEFAMARLNLGMAQLKLGDWRAGWDNYEARWTGSAEASNGQMARPACALPQWDGQGGTEGQRLLVVTEQGFGDTFQFARYLALAAARFAKVGFVCASPTHRVMEWTFADRVVLMTRMPSDVDAWDWQCPLMSLPRAFRTTVETIPADVPYLRVPAVAAAHWRERLDLAAPGRLRVGIAWAGRKGHQYDARRSLAFRQLQPLFADARITWVSLQKWSPEEGPPQVPTGVDWLDWTEELTDFADTAALASGLDLVLSIDSSLVHLAGALGRPVWMMNRFDGEWRWLRHRDDSPWYPALRIFNQPAFGDWDSVIAAVRAALAALPVPRQAAERRARKALPPAPPPTGLGVDQAMQLAGQYQSAGRLAEAEGLLTQILQAQPGHAHALHLLGVVAWISGRHDRAVALVREAIDGAADVALFHSNLAEMYRQQGRLAEAVAHGERAVALDPAMASAHSNLGIALCDAGEFERAEACHRHALRLAPDLVQSLDNLGSIRRARHDLPGAADWYRKALVARPDYPESLSNLGAVLVEDHRAAEAEPLLERALQLRPEYPEALCNLGLARLALERTDSAIGLLQRSLQLRPGYHEATVGLARAMHAADRLTEAAALLEDAVAQREGRADVWCLLGVVRTELADADGAEAAYRRALALDPAHADALTGLGNLSLEGGRLDEAETFLKQAIALKPDDVAPRFHLVQVRKVRPDDANLAALEAMLPIADSLRTDQRITLHYALGKAWDDLKAWDRAFGRFLEGARLKRAKLHHDPDAEAARAARIAAVVDRDFVERLRGAGDPSDVPVFVLGMPRSGTTLTEQIIASHPDVHGAGELRDLMDIVQRQTPGGGDRGYPDNLAGLTPGIASQWGRDYVARLRARAPGARRITDKMPANYLALGLIPLLVPNARIIHVQRDAADTCVSCFTRLFHRHQDATYDLAELGRHYVAYARLMQHWRAVLPAGSFLDVRYEDIVTDTEVQARRLVAFCGLDWNDACLAFHETQRTVRTASAAQVRQPVYSSSVERWRHYEKHLGPLLDALGEYGPAR